MSMVQRLDRTLYPDTQNNWDSKAFREMILDRIGPDDTVLDLGAGRGHLDEMNFAGRARRIVGLDPDQAVLENPNLDEAKLLDLSTGDFPFDDRTFDVVFANSVLEHVSDPVKCFSEIRRVLKPGGRFLAKTPNRWHYMPLLATALPHSFHTVYNRLRGRQEVDTFPTLYRCNSRRQIERLAKRTDLELTGFRAIEGRPEYLRIAWPVYLAGWAYERMVNATDALSAMRIVLLFELTRP
ncbi:MAG: class I SAM-dependent methyltransferase, partial [Planctomycetota bacterium]